MPNPIKITGTLSIDTDGIGDHHNDTTAQDTTSAMLDKDGKFVFRYTPNGANNPAGVRFLDADRDEYAVAPKTLSAEVGHGPKRVLHVGDKVTVTLPDGSTYSAPIGDYGNAGKEGEFSYLAVKKMGVQIIPTNNGPIPTLDGQAASDIRVTVTFYPGTAP